VAPGALSPNPRHGESPVKVVQLRKVARRLFGIGESSDDDAPIRLGMARATLFWRRGWRWEEGVLDGGLPLGLQGGPMLSLDLPLQPSDRGRSLGARFCWLRYLFHDPRAPRLLDELANPHQRRHGLELALNLSVAF
jgi:hypothetical protein